MSMNDAMPNAFQIPLGEETRKKGQWLVFMGMISIAMVWTGLSPERITALSLDFGRVNQSAFYWMLIITIAYFILGFSFYAVYEGLENRARFYRQESEKHARLAAEAAPLPGKTRLTDSAVQFYEAKLFHNPAHKRIYALRMVYD